MLSLDDILPLHLADLTFPDSHPLRGQKGQVFAFAICHSSGVVLFETGFGRGNERLSNLYQVVHRPIEAELAQYRLLPNEVRAIANSYLHFDHCGGNALFPGTPIYVQVDELRAAHLPNYTVPQWVDFPDTHYRQIEGDREIATGLRILSAPGHAPGHQALQIDTNGGWSSWQGRQSTRKQSTTTSAKWGELIPEDAQEDPVKIPGIRSADDRP